MLHICTPRMTAKGLALTEKNNSAIKKHHMANGCVLEISLDNKLQLKLPRNATLKSYGGYFSEYIKKKKNFLFLNSQFL